MDFTIEDVRKVVDTFDPDEPTGDPFLDWRYNWHVEKFGHPEPYYRLFYRLAEVLKPRMVVELGAWRGSGAAHWAPHSGTVVTIDHHSDPGDEENRDWCLEVQQHYSNLFYLPGWTWDVAADVRTFGKFIDVLFIDSWHVYDKAMKEWVEYEPMLRHKPHPDDNELEPGSLVICDDITDGEFTTVRGMMRFWEEISHRHRRFLVDGIAPFSMGFFKWTDPAYSEVSYR